VAFYLSAGLALLGAIIWYISSAYNALTGRGDLVIAPFTITDHREGKDSSHGAALAKMLQARLQELEHNLAISQEALLRKPAAQSSPAAQLANSSSESAEAHLSVVPALFVAQGAALQTTLLEPAQVNISVGGVEVGGVIPWLQRLLVNRRTLEFTYYEKDKSVIVSGSLQALGLLGEALRIEVPKNTDNGIDLDEVAHSVAAEIVRRRIARDPSNRVEALNTSEFRELVGVLDDAARLKRQVTLGRPARERYVELLARIEPLASEVRDWYQLQALAASIAESANKPDKVLTFARNEKEGMAKALQDADRRLKGELEQQIKDLTAQIETLRSTAVAMTQPGEEDARRKIEEDARRATEAFNQLFHHQLKPLPVELLPAHNPNAYTDGVKFFAPPAVAQLPEITWHDMSWQHFQDCRVST